MVHRMQSKVMLLEGILSFRVGLFLDLEFLTIHVPDYVGNWHEHVANAQKGQNKTKNVELIMQNKAKKDLPCGCQKQSCI